MIIDRDFCERWVIPFYMQSLHARQSPAVTAQLTDACNAVTPEIVEALLADLNWRTRKMAAVYAGIKRWNYFTAAIGENLVESKVCCAGASYCFALARFNSEASVNYLKQYLDIWLEQPECWYDQQHVLSALLWLDQVRGSEEAAPYMTANGPWLRFVSNKPYWDLEQTRQSFSETMMFCQEQFPQ